MFPPMAVGGDELVLRPANCPHHALIYAAAQHSYRELPVRLNELAAMFRAERSGVLSGLSRVRQINLDDTHVFCRPDQLADEAARGLRAALRAQETLGLRWTTYGSRCATTTPCTSAPPPSGRKRKTRCGRARRLPLWLAPVQVCVLPVGPAQDQAARALADALLAAGLRPRLEPDGSLGARIRHSRQRRDHLIAVIGESEAAVGAVQVTDVGHGFRGLVSAADLVKLAGAAYRERSGQVSWPE
jgi:threonyl-tRNA synthetase